MASMTEEYKIILEDVGKYKDLSHRVKAGLFERLLVRSLPISKIHPNPVDEFCDPAIGPNYGIVTEYQQTIRKAQREGTKIFDEALVVEKMSYGEYRLLNGHHRWMAARMSGLKKNISVEITNSLSDEELIYRIHASKRDKCASFDLDEVLMLPPKEDNSRIADRELKKNAGLMIDELRQMGFDVWVYSGNVHSQKGINKLFKDNKCKVDGIISGMKHRKGGQSLKKAFADKYSYSLHIDNESIMLVNT